jgi:hypothetical protein
MRAQFIAAAWTDLKKPGHYFHPHLVGHKANLSPDEIAAVVAALVAEQRLEKAPDGRVRFWGGDATYALSVIRALERQQSAQSRDEPAAVKYDERMDLNDRQGNFLLAAFALAPHEGIAFSWRDAGAHALFDPSESYDLCHQIERGGLARLEGEKAYLTPDGRELARRIKAIKPPNVLLDDADQRFLLAAERAARPGEDFDIEAVAESAGIADFDPIRDRLLEVEFLGIGSGFGCAFLAPRGIDALRQIKRMKLLVALYGKTSGTLTESANLVALAKEMDISETDASQAAAELSRGGLVNGRYGGNATLTEAGRQRAESLLKK